MHVFRGVAPVPTAEGLEALVTAVLEGLQRLAKPRSLAELRADEDDYRLLRGWMREVDAGQIREGLRPTWRRARHLGGDLYSRRDGLGLLFLFLAAETARREAAEGEAWPPVRRCLTREVEAELFVQGQPTMACKEAI